MPTYTQPGFWLEADRTSPSRSGLELAHDCVERDVQGGLVGIVGLDRQIAAQLAIRRAVRERHRLRDRLDGGGAARNVEHLHRMRALVAQLENSHDILTSRHDAERNLRG